MDRDRSRTKLQTARAVHRDAASTGDDAGGAAEVRHAAAIDGQRVSAVVQRGGGSERAGRIVGPVLIRGESDRAAEGDRGGGGGFIDAATDGDCLACGADRVSAGELVEDEGIQSGRAGKGHSTASGIGATKGRIGAGSPGLVGGAVPPKVVSEPRARSVGLACGAAVGIPC